MNTDERILQVLENSACLSKGQLLGYVKHTLYPEELRAVELHLSGCPICNDALDGLEQQTDIEALLASLVPPVLPAVTPKEKPKEKKEIAPVIRAEKATLPKPPVSTEPDINEPADLAPKRTGWKRNVGIAAALVLGFGALWYFEFRPKQNEDMLATNARIEKEKNNEVSSYENRQINNEPQISSADDVLSLAEATVGKDSVVVPVKDAVKVKSIKDSASVSAGMLARKTVTETSDVAESKEVQDKPKEEPVAAKPVEKAKEESAKKEELTDYENGLKLYKQNQYASALLYLKDAERDEDNPKHWDAVFYSALCNKYLGKDRKARKQFERIVKADGAYKKAAQKQLDEMKSRD